MPQHCYNSYSWVHVMVTLVRITVNGIWGQSLPLEEAVGTAGAVLFCQSNSQQIVALQCICAYVYMYDFVCVRTMCKCSTCSFSILLCNNPLCHRSQRVKHAGLYLLKFVACLPKGIGLAFRLPCACGTPVLGYPITSFTLELGHPHHKIYTDFI